MKKLLGGILIAIGILVAGVSGVCTLASFSIDFFDGIVIGIGLLFAGLALVRSTSRKESPEGTLVAIGILVAGVGGLCTIVALFGQSEFFSLKTLCSLAIGISLLLAGLGLIFTARTHARPLNTQEKISRELAMKNLLGGILMVIGILVAGVSGACTLASFSIDFFDGIVIGIGLFFAGLAFARSTSRKELLGGILIAIGIPVAGAGGLYTIVTLSDQSEFSSLETLCVFAIGSILLLAGLRLIFTERARTRPLSTKERKSESGRLPMTLMTKLLVAF